MFPKIFQTFSLGLLLCLVTTNAFAQGIFVNEFDENLPFTQGKVENNELFDNVFPILGGGYNTVLGLNLYVGVIYNAFGTSSPDINGFFMSYTGGLGGGKFNVGYTLNRPLPFRLGLSLLGTASQPGGGATSFSRYIGGEGEIRYKIFNLGLGLYQGLDSTNSEDQLFTISAGIGF